MKKPVVMECFVFEYRGKSVLKVVYGILDHHDFNASLNNKTFWIFSSSKSAKLFSETLMGAVKPALTDKYEFQLLGDLGNLSEMDY